MAAREPSLWCIIHRGAVADSAFQMLKRVKARRRRGGGVGGVKTGSGVLPQRSARAALEGRSELAAPERSEAGPILACCR